MTGLDRMNKHFLCNLFFFILCNNTEMYNICVEHIMMRDIKYIWQNIKYHELESILKVSKLSFILSNSTKSYNLNF